MDAELWVPYGGAERSLTLHAGARREPERMLRLMLERADMAAGAVGELERRVAGILGKAAALLFPSGTMAQQVSLRVHAERLGRRAVAFHPQAHLEVHEQHGYQVVHGLRALLLAGPSQQPDSAERTARPFHKGII